MTISNPNPGVYTSISTSNVNANSGSAYTIDPTNGNSFNVTLNSATPTITLQTPPASTISQVLKVNFIQDGTGGRVPTFSGVTWLNGYAPSVLQAIGAITPMEFWYTNGICYGIFTPLALSVVTATLASGSATSLTSTTAKTITSISVPAGNWIIFGNVGFVEASGTVITRMVASISDTNNTHATSPNGGAYSESNATQAATTTPVLPTGSMYVSLSSTTTYYLVATATFSVSTLTAFGSITAVPVTTG